MKLSPSHLLVTAILALLFSCDKVSNPVQNPDQFVDTTSYVRKVLLEDYTGHYCGNCPNAAKVAENLDKQYGGKVIVVAVHAGWFAKLYPPDYVTSYTTTAGNDWDGTSGFGISMVGNPNGMVNRKNYNDNGLIQKETKWPTTVSLALADTYILGLEPSLNYNASTRILNTTVKAKFKSDAGYPNSVKLSVILLEDSIIGDQKDYTKSPDHVSDYVFMHVLRGAINGSWGTDLKTGPIKAGDSVSVSFNNFAIDPKFKEKHLTVVAFAYDANSREVLQVEKAKLIKSQSGGD